MSILLESPAGFPIAQTTENHSARRIVRVFNNAVIELCAETGDSRRFPRLLKIIPEIERDVLP